MGTLLKTFWKLMAFLAGFALLASPAMAADVTVRVYESTLEDFAKALGPLKSTGHFSVFGYSGDYVIKVTNIEFTIEENKDIGIDGKMNVKYWRFSVDFKLKATAAASYDSSARFLKLKTTHTAVKPCFSGICLPVSISIGKTFSFNIPVKSAKFDFGTASGQQTLRLVPQNVSLTNKDGYIELQGDVVLW